MVAQKKSFALRIDPELMKIVEKWASDEFRSINGQLEWIIADAVRKVGRNRKTPSKKIIVLAKKT